MLKRISWRSRLNGLKFYAKSAGCSAQLRTYQKGGDHSGGLIRGADPLERLITLARRCICPGYRPNTPKPFGI